MRELTLRRAPQDLEKLANGEKNLRDLFVFTNFAFFAARNLMRKFSTTRGRHAKFLDLLSARLRELCATARIFINLGNLRYSARRKPALNLQTDIIFAARAMCFFALKGELLSCCAIVRKLQVGEKRTPFRQFGATRVLAKHSVAKLALIFVGEFSKKTR